MKLYLILPLIAAAGFTVEPVALGQGVAGKGFGSGHAGGHQGGFGGSGAGPASVASRGARSASMGGTATGAASRAASVSGGGGHHRGHHGHHHGHHGHHHGHHGHHGHHHFGHRFSRLPQTYPSSNFGNFGFSANYNTAYYRGGFRQNTAPYGFPATFQSAYVSNPYSSYGYAPSNRIFSYGTSSRFRPYTGIGGGVTNVYPAYTGTTYSPYYQGQIVPGYRPYGVYGPNGAYTVPSGGVGTAAIQSRLMNAGYYAGPVDGFAGPLTRAAISRYQYQYGLPVTGRIDGFLVRQMRESAFY